MNKKLKCGLIAAILLLALGAIILYLAWPSTSTTQQATPWLWLARTMESAGIHTQWSQEVLRRERIRALIQIIEQQDMRNSIPQQVSIGTSLPLADRFKVPEKTK